MPVKRPWPVRFFAILMRVALPPDFRKEVGESQLDAFEDEYHALRKNGRTAQWISFWFREITGVIRTATAEHRERIFDNFQKTNKRPTESLKGTNMMLGNIRRDLAYSLRVITRTPVVSAIAVLSLAIGVSVNTTIFSLLHSWLLRPLPYEQSERLVMLYENNRNDSDDTDPVSPANYFDWIDQTDAFENVAASRFKLANLTGIDRPEQLTISVVTPNFFQLLGTTAVMGRVFQPDEGGANSTPVIAIGETLWITRFGRDPDILGKTLTLDGSVYSVVGVIPGQFDFILGSVSAWVASDFRDVQQDRANHSLTVTARLRDNVTPEQAQAELTATALRLEDQFPETNRDWGVNVKSIRSVFPGPTDRGLVNILMTVVLLVLLVACANIASLLMAKTETRQKEMAIRAALGAGKQRIMRQLLTESVVMALLGGTLGLASSVWGIRAVINALPEELPGFFAPEMNSAVFGFGLLVSVLAGLTFGVTPAMQAISGDLKTPLTEGGRGGTASKKKKRVRQAFVIAEFAIALTVLMGAAVLTDLFQRRLNVETGFDSRNMLTLELTLPEHRYDNPPAIVSFTDELERGLRGIPGAETATLTTMLPRSRNISFSRFSIDEVPAEPGREPEATGLSIGSGYFESLGIRVVTGRTFSTVDRPDTPPVVMVNQRMVDTHFDGVSPVGKRITVAGESREIIGVAHNIAQQRLSGLMPEFPSVYFPFAQRPMRRMRIAIRSEGDPYDLVGPVQQMVWSIDPDQPITAIQTMDEHIAAELAAPNVLAKILLIVGLLALSLSAIGIYGVMAYSVTQQTSEIGIRMALGARQSTVVGRITRQGAKLAGLGLVLGVPLASAVTLMIANILARGASADGIGEVQVLSYGPLVTVGSILVAVALLASYLPARRAIKIDPIVALQRE